MPRNLTAKQEAFAQLVASGCNYSAAYRQSYNVAGSSPDTLWHNASRLAEHTHVALRIQELQASDEAIMMEKRALTAENLVDEAFTNLKGARRDKQWGSANGAVEWIGKATGLVTGDKAQGVTAPVTQIIINLAPGVEMPKDILGQAQREIVEVTEFREILEEE